MLLDARLIETEEKASLTSHKQNFIQTNAQYQYCNMLT